MQRGNQQQQSRRRIEEATDIKGIASRKIERIAQIQADRAGRIQAGRVTRDVGKFGKGHARPSCIRIAASLQHGAIEAAQRGRNIRWEIDAMKRHRRAREGRTDQIAPLFGQDTAFRQ